MNRIELAFALCDPAPSRGYQVWWRVAGSSDALTDAGHFFSSPAVFYDEANPAGTLYEGIIRSDCRGVYGDPVLWGPPTEESGESGESGEESGESGSEMGYELEVRMDINEFGVCSGLTQIVYVNVWPAALSPGLILYDDAAMTIPHTGHLFVREQYGLNYYNLDISSGEVGTLEGVC